MTNSAERVDLAPGYSVARIINGCWQLSPSHGGGPESRREVLARFAELVEQGFTTFDCADIYEGTEQLLGEFRRTLEDPDSVQIHTKYVPDEAALPDLKGPDVVAAIERSLRRLAVERLDLLQFHWWSYDVPGIERVVETLTELQLAGKIRLIGVTNFDTAHLRDMLEGGASVVSTQTQYSLLDRRPENRLNDYLDSSGVHMLAYGALAGGFLSERWLDAAAPRSMNRSLQKYRLIIDEGGGWERYQALLHTLDGIARKHSVSISVVAARWVLDRPQVAAVILGTGRQSHMEQLARVRALSLDTEDRHLIAESLAMLTVPAGDTYELERDPHGPHQAIIRTNLRDKSEERA